MNTRRMHGSRTSRWNTGLGLAGLIAALGTSGLAGTNPPVLPDPRMTPGDVLAVTKADICVPGYSSKVRDVPSEVKKQAYAEYGILSHKPGEYEVDHLISLELGGSNSLKNLWPESYLTQPWNARVKDALENELHREICNGQVSMAAAQHDIATDWIAAYKKYFHTQVPLSKGGKSGKGVGGMMAGLRGARKPHMGNNAPAPANSNGLTRVWVNTKSGKYFYPGAQYYGKTKEGKYLTEADAKRQGFVAAKER